MVRFLTAQIGLIGVLIVLGPMRLLAQSDTSRVLNEIEVRANYEKESLPAQKIRRSDFLKNSAFNVAEAIRGLSGVNVKDYGGIGGMKTVSVRSLGTSHTGVLMDGVPMSDSQNGQIDLGRISIESVESITLFNAQPTSILLPAAAFTHGSVVALNSSIAPLDSSKSRELSLKFRGGSFGLLSPNISGVHRIGPSKISPWYIKYAAGIEKATGEYSYKVDGDGSTTRMDRTNADVNIKRYDVSVNHYRSDQTRFYFKMNYYDSYRGLPGAVVFYNPVSNQRLWNNDFYAQSAWEQKWGKWSTLLTGKYTRGFTKYVDPDFKNSLGELINTYTQDELFGSIATTLSLNNALKLGNSFDYSRSTLLSNRLNFANPIRHTLQNATNLTYQYENWFLQSTILFTQINEQLEIGDNPVTRHNVSPSLVVNYIPSGASSVNFRAFYKKGFRNPTFNDLYYTLAGERRLKPEKADQWNLGMVWSPYLAKRKLLYVTTDLYFNRITDKIIALPNKDLFVWSMLNLGKVHILGLETNATFKIPLFNRIHGVSKLNYTFQRAIDVTNPEDFNYKDQIAYTPIHTGNLNLGIEKKELGIYINRTQTSKRFYIPQNAPEYEVEGIHVTDLSSKYSVFLGQTKLTSSFEITNVFNERYVVIRSFPMPGRSYRLTIQLTI